MRSDESSKCSSRHGGEGGFTLIETLISITLLTTVSLGVAQLFAVSALANRTAWDKTAATMLAQQKMEQLRGLTWGYQRLPDGETGPPATDTVTDLSVEPPTASGPGLLPSPNGTLETNTSMYVDYLGPDGAWVGTGPAAPAGTAYVRRWSVEPLPASPNDTVVLQVMVTTLRQEQLRQTRGASRPRGRLPADTWLASVKTRKAQ